ncbi:hypothetical protein D3C73_1253670 [compost metagenome]
MPADAAATMPLASIAIAPATADDTAVAELTAWRAVLDMPFASPCTMLVPYPSMSLDGEWMPKKSLTLSPIPLAIFFAVFTAFAFMDSRPFSRH